MELERIARIRTGYPFRGRVERVEAGGCWLAQVGNIDPLKGEVSGELLQIGTPPNYWDHSLKVGDILLIARGLRNTAACFTNPDLQVIAASHLMIIRPNYSAADSGYLTWYLNLPETQNQIRAMQSGSSVPFVPVGTLGQLEVPLPDLRLQRQISKIHQLGAREQELLERIKSLRQQLLDGLLLEALRRGTNPENLSRDYSMGKDVLA